jgi:uncharacterized protein YpiB (UPF0302 family)
VVGCHACEENVKYLLENIDQFLATKDVKTLPQLCSEMESFRGWLLVQWGIKKEVKDGVA